MAEHYRSKLEEVTRENQQVRNRQTIFDLFVLLLSFMTLLMD
jgi:hypothetical protein